MEKVISGNALRGRLLKRLEDTLARPHDDWVHALATPGNRELLGLIAIHRPQSISELSESAGRAQSNVSRSLTALINAGLIEIRSEGRVSIPTLTDLGREKAQEIGLLERPSAAPAAAALSQPDKGDLPFLSVSFADDEASDDEIMGDLVATVILRGYDEPVVAKMPSDLNAAVLAILDHWWRMLYRRDAPYKIGEFGFASGSSERRISLAVNSTGDHIERVLRSLDEPRFQIERTMRFVSVDAFERDLLDNVVRPVASRMRSRRRYDRPIQSKLARLEDTYSQSRELSFARTAGALGVTPYELSDVNARAIHDLITLIPDQEPRLDFASAVLTEYGDAAEWTRAEILKHGIRNAMAGLCELSKVLRHDPKERGIRPWQLGYAVAGTLRARLSLKPDMSVPGVAKLAAIFGAETFQTSPSAPASLRAFQTHLNGAPTMVVEEEGAPRTKFTLARAIGDFLAFRNNASCVADLYTDRQAVGRAFAAEFTAPAEGVVRMIEDEDQSFERVANHYGVPRSVIQHQYENSFSRLVEA